VKAIRPVRGERDLAGLIDAEDPVEPKRVPAIRHVDARHVLTLMQN